MQTKKGNIAVIVLIIIIVAITATVIGWMFGKKSNKVQPIANNNQEQPYIGGEPRSLLYTQPKDEGADWQTYTDTKFGYSIRYPKDYEMKMIKDDVAAFGRTGFSAPASLSINVFRPTPPASLDAFITAGKNNFEIGDCYKTNISSEPAYECLYLGAITYYAIISEHKGYIYEFLLNTGNKDSFAESREALDTNQKLLLSTFKFTN